ncbi:hypothetical protein OYE22_24515 [Streptomyces sp. 71268]|uniref:hypothetical protein n=1 Tax=Streptomyces sp. 71268 TaxID=3002640 RepID=UPI0023F67D35|nr:hypothetical protein [Streptomyces sp. 71268]WEV27980.1 hypothetical protein OYE22_24515 [Streptomyces sp. 71268]
MHTSTPFLARAAEAAMTMGGDGYRLLHLDIPTRRLTFADTGAAPAPGIFLHGSPRQAADRAWRADHDWQPAPKSPPHLQLAWLLDDMSTWLADLSEIQVTVDGLDAPVPDWCDVLLRDGDTRLRARVQLANRNEPLDFPGMYLRDLFAEGRASDYVADEFPHVVDLRTVL